MAFSEQLSLRAVGIVGLGLIGGSMARAFQKYTTLRVYGCDTNPQTAMQAERDGAVDAAGGPELLSRCGLVLVALYPQQTVTFVREQIERFAPGSILVDLCGVKRYPVENLTSLCAGHGVTFIGGHPMAGKETWGFSGSDADLFQQASMILTPDDHTPPDALALASELFRQIGFGRITLTTPEAHDRMIAFTSQLAHVVSSAYIKSPRALQRSGFSAGSYKDLTRVAKLNPEMWTELFLENGDDLVEEIDESVLHLNEYRDAISQKDGTRLYTLLDDGRRIKEALQ